MELLVIVVVGGGVGEVVLRNKVVYFINGVVKHMLDLLILLLDVIGIRPRERTRLLVFA
jgi:hypothetical protein